MRTPVKARAIQTALVIMVLIMFAFTGCASEGEHILIDPMPTIEAQPNMAMVPVGLVSNAYDHVVFEIVRSPITHQCYEIIRYRGDNRSTTSHGVSCSRYTPAVEQ